MLCPHTRVPNDVDLHSTSRRTSGWRRWKGARSADWISQLPCRGHACMQQQQQGARVVQIKGRKNLNRTTQETAHSHSLTGSAAPLLLALRAYQHDAGQTSSAAVHQMHGQLSCLEVHAYTSDSPP